MAAVLFRLPRTRHPLLRALSTLLGLLVIGVTLVFGFFLVLGLAAIGAAVWAARQFAKRPDATGADPSPRAQADRPAPAGVIEGEFVVVREPVSPPR
ncbi:MAG TPA: hypothetical protein VLF18_12190 [Tahibacter sp.]|uniref:hypothetical protein n=1 Tax=Tahibacter sp. TaxID=2056211 RepID=UPI002B65CC05|nr:hypothetical protein [Tahibacter sp.]HSX60953.1 hypothetical protein [Tahibacter sp.]